jgi:hypothetical protein
MGSIQGKKTEFEARATVPLRRLFVPLYEVPGDLQNSQSRIFTVSSLMGGFLRPGDFIG